MMIRRSLVAGLILLCAASVRAAGPAGLSSSEQVSRELPIYPGGLLVLSNPFGDIDIVGTDDSKLTFTAEKLIRGLDNDALADGKQQTQLVLGGDASRRLISTLVPPVHSSRWSSSMRYVVKVPRTVHLNVTSSGEGRIHIANMRATVFVKCFRGLVSLERLTGASTVLGTNSNILFTAPERGMSDAALGTINGNIEIHAPSNLRFRWEAETIKGDLRTSFPMQGAFVGSRFRGSVNGEGGPLLATQSFNGTIALLQQGTSITAARSVRPLPGGPDRQGVQRVEMRPLELLSVQGFFRYFTNLGDIVIGQIHGNAELSTAAGQVQLGAVFGDCQVTSRGGPLNLGQIDGLLSARTEAGDITVESARKGGTIITGGGTIRVSYTGGETRLNSGGGDIFVRQAGGPVYAETQSGDITVIVDGDLKTDRITARTAKGNLILIFPAMFSADIDATLITSDSEGSSVSVDFTGLQFRREEIGGKTRIRATGKLNGGGDRIELYAEGGGIQITTRATAPAQ